MTHKLVKLKGRITWPVCARCGLVALRNDASRKALRAPCPGKEDADGK